MEAASGPATCALIACCRAHAGFRGQLGSAGPFLYNRTTHGFCRRAWERAWEGDAYADRADAAARAAADPDVALMLRLQAGDESAFQELFRKFAPRVLQLARRFVGSDAQAEELTQDVFVQIFRFRHRYKPQSR